MVFVGYFLASVAMMCHIEIGLDQALSMPEVCIKIKEVAETGQGKIVIFVLSPPYFAFYSHQSITNRTSAICKTHRSQVKFWAKFFEFERNCLLPLCKISVFGCLGH